MALASLPVVAPSEEGRRGRQANEEQALHDDPGEDDPDANGPDANRWDPNGDPSVPAEAAVTRVRVWLSHDGYRDPDDNLSLLLGTAYARDAAAGDPDVRVRGLVFGDTRDGGQYYTLHPDGTAPAAFGEDDRYGDAAGNAQAAGNYAFFQEYGTAALREMAPGWQLYDTLADDDGGRRAWAFHATAETQISAAARAIADDIADAVGLGFAADGSPEKLVVYSAGGGANVAAEAIGYLLGQGYGEADLVGHFAVVQHGNNWTTNYEAEARTLTRAFTVVISNQNYAEYANGAAGPDLKHALAAGVAVDGSHFGAAFDTALQVAIGAAPFEGLDDDATFKPTRDASDAGSHAFAVDRAALLAALDDRLGAGEDLHSGYDWAHLIDTGNGGTRPREIYAGLDAGDVPALLDGTLLDRPDGDPTQGGRATVSLAGGDGDRESLGGEASGELELGQAGGQANVVSLHFGDALDALGLDPDAEIRSAYLLFQARQPGEAGGGLRIDLLGDGASAVRWDDLGAWTAGETYRSPDLAALVSGAIDGKAGDEITFEITGTGQHVAQSYESDGLGPELVITWDLG